MKKGTGWLIFIFILIVILSLIDIGLNLLGIIPYVGSAFETLSETVLEFMQILLTAVGLFLASKLR